MVLDYPNLMALAYKLAKKSPDPSNQNGAVVVHPDFPHEVFGAGCNEFGPVPYSTLDLENREWKLSNIEHAERSALFDAANRNCTKGCVLVCPWACCTDCGRAIGRMGVSKLVVHRKRMDTTPSRWLKSVQQGLNLVSLHGCEIEYYDGPINLHPGFTIRANGEDWNIHTGEVTNEKD